MSIDVEFCAEHKEMSHIEISKLCLKNQIWQGNGTSPPPNGQGVVPPTAWRRSIIGSMGPAPAAQTKVTLLPLGVQALTGCYHPRLFPSLDWIHFPPLTHTFLLAISLMVSWNLLWDYERSFLPIPAQRCQWGGQSSIPFRALAPSQVSPITTL